MPSPTTRRYLVTGGAGYVGSHTVAALLARGDEVVVLDSLAQGHRAAVLAPARLVQADLNDPGTAGAVLSEGRWDGVLHFASLSLVGESMQEPMRYMRENVGVAARLLEACARHGVPRFVFSSSAAIYGSPSVSPIIEDTPPDPTNAYGESKLAVERMLRWATQVHGLRCAALRYFNAAGADPQGRLGEDHDPETHLIPRAIDAVLGRDELVVAGRDWPTHDGTPVRDYVHVADLADAHILALGRLDKGSFAANLATGRGNSVLEVVEAVRAVSGQEVPMRVGPRRPGDPIRLVASGAWFRQETGWSPRFTDLRETVRTAWEWRRAHPRGYDDRA